MNMPEKTAMATPATHESALMGSAAAPLESALAEVVAEVELLVLDADLDADEDALEEVALAAEVEEAAPDVELAAAICEETVALKVPVIPERLEVDGQHRGMRGRIQASRHT